MLEVLGERQRTEAVRRSRRPRWAQASFALAELPAGEGAGSVRLTLCDLDHNVIGSGAANLPAENDSGGATVAVELLSAACDLPAECHGVAGTIELRIARDRADLPEAEAEAEEAPLERIRSCPVASASARHGGTELFTRQMLPVRFNLLGAGNDRLKRWCVCDGCHSLPQIDDASTELLVLRGCSHATCAHCLVTATTQALAAALDGSTDGIRVACPEPGCGGVVQPDEIYKGLPNHPILVEYAEESMDDTLGRILSADVTMVNCPQCASSFGMKPGTVGELTVSPATIRFCTSSRFSERSLRLLAGRGERCDARRNPGLAQGLRGAPRPLPGLLSRVLLRLPARTIPLRRRELRSCEARVGGMRVPFLRRGAGRSRRGRPRGWSLRGSREMRGQGRA